MFFSGLFITHIQHVIKNREIDVFIPWCFAPWQKAAIGAHYIYRCIMGNFECPAVFFVDVQTQYRERLKHSDMEWFKKNKSGGKDVKDGAKNYAIKLL